MTTHLPYPPQQQPQPPPPAYSTAPPWAPPPAAPPPAPFGDPHLQHGQLLVPYPEEMQNAARPAPPAWWPVVAWTFFFGILGLISVRRRATMARRGRNSVAPYWVAWSVTMAVGLILSAGIVAVGVPALADIREQAVTKVVQERIVTDGTLASTARVTASSATCDPVGERGADGLRLYDCVLTLADGRTGTLAVTADADGNWSVVPPTKK